MLLHTEVLISEVMITFERVTSEQFCPALL